MKEYCGKLVVFILENGSTKKAEVCQIISEESAYVAWEGGEKALITLGGKDIEWRTIEN